MVLTFNIVLTHGTGSTLIGEGELGIIKNILLKTDRDGIIANVSGRGLYKLAQVMLRTAPYKDAVALVTATYRVSIPILFANPLLLRPIDSILDTKRYSTIELYVTFGTIADLMTSAGTDTITANMDVSIVKSEKPLGTGQKELPLVKPYIASFPPVDPAVLQYLEFEKADDLAIAQLIALSCNTATAGVPFSGVPADTIIDTWSVEDNVGFPVQSIKHYNLQHLAKIEQQIETWPAGLIFYNFIKDGSIFSAYKTGDKSKARLSWVNGTLSTSGVTLAMWGIREMKR